MGSDGIAQTRHIDSLMGRTSTQNSDVRVTLINKGVLTAAGRGAVSFSPPDSTTSSSSGRTCSVSTARSSRPETRDPRHETRDPRPETRDPHPIRHHQPPQGPDRAGAVLDRHRPQLLGETVPPVGRPALWWRAKLEQ